MSENALVTQEDALAILQAAGVVLEKPKEDAPRISIKGKMFRYFLNGEWHSITKEEDGEVVNATLINAVVLGHAPTRSYALFEGGFKDGESQAPACWSHDSKTPDSTVQEPNNPTCEGCEKRVVGSAFTEGGQATRACRESRLISVALIQSATEISQPLQLRLAVGSLWQSKENAVLQEAQGWYSYDAYVAMLSKMGIAHPCMVATRIKFGDGAGTTLLFKMAGRLGADDLLKAAKLAGSDEVKKTLGQIKRDSAAATPKPEAAKAIAAPVAEKATVVVEKATAAPVEVRPEPVVEKPKAVKKPEPKAVPVEAPAALDDQLADW